MLHSPFEFVVSRFMLDCYMLAVIDLFSFQCIQIGEAVVLDAAAAAICSNVFVITFHSSVHNDGLELKLVMLTGTVPIHYNGTQYNIPIDLYLRTSADHLC